MQITTRSLAELISKALGKNIPYQELGSGANREISDGLNRTGRGHRRQRTMIQGDLARAVNQQRTERLTQEEFTKHTLRLDSDGFVVERAPGEVAIVVENLVLIDNSEDEEVGDAEGPMVDHSAKDTLGDTDTDSEADEDYAPEPEKRRRRFTQNPWTWERLIA
ncbi:uncharacterized protein N7483_006774 [Penicillium malachiteum]|uniref:uncharacterized protein n=1 Tax=Penicillium malachiteum TaxID=1324776 RepID=UPI002549A063|nr:uncharacterized protein N7483_006774 [Penicillium malachiteum]KAJ5725417.1 hypothetical protein N7483_006774 [Penicillium malachiteum]